MIFLKGGLYMSQDEKIDELLKMMKDLKEQADRQEEKIDYIVKRLNHMRDKAHKARERETSWPK